MLAADSDRIVSRAAEDRAQRILRGYLDHDREFQTLTAAAEAHFQSADWPAAQRDARRRLDLFGEATARVVAALPSGEREQGWRQTRLAFDREVETLPNRELARTFYNSVVRRARATEGIDAEREFDAPPIHELPIVPDTMLYRFDTSQPIAQWLQQLLARCLQGCLFVAKSSL